MKKLTILIFILLILPLAKAEVTAKIIYYNAETTESRILLSNSGPEDYNDLTVIIDNAATDLSGSLLKAKTGWVILKLVQPGAHEVKITNGKQTIFSQEILFPRAAPQTQNYIAPVVKDLKKQKQPTITFVLLGIAVIVGGLILIAKMLKQRQPPMQKPLQRIGQRNRYVGPVYRKR